MPLLLLVAFILVPIVEVSLIDRVQELLGWPVTIAILVLDSVLGAILVRQEGMRAWRRFTGALAEGRPPATEVVDGALILFGGALLLTPGFFTDVVGLVCVLAPTRVLLRGVLTRRFAAGGGLGSIFLIGGRGPGRPRGGGAEDGERRPRRPRRPGVIDVEVIDVQRSTPPPVGEGPDAGTQDDTP